MQLVVAMAHKHALTAHEQRHWRQLVCGVPLALLRQAPAAHRVLLGAELLLLHGTVAEHLPLGSQLLLLQGHAGLVPGLLWGALPPQQPVAVQRPGQLQHVAKMQQPQQVQQQAGMQRLQLGPLLLLKHKV